MVEHLTLNQGVRGSSPRRPTSRWIDYNKLWLIHFLRNRFKYALKNDKYTLKNEIPDYKLFNLISRFDLFSGDLTNIIYFRYHTAFGYHAVFRCYTAFRYYTPSLSKAGIKLSLAVSPSCMNPFSTPMSIA